jgi:subtilisin family serine protease
MSRADDASFRDWRYETFEDRLALSAQSVADFAHELVEQSLAAGSIVEPSSAVQQPLLQPLTSEGHGWTDLAAARAQYGLYGDGQTVAVIDSGIAYDHVALGGSLGSAYKVVGGWDFAENDANPYDDGPAGFHGTHVSGIIGSTDSRYPGVAPNVDLVGLRVFDDQGNGNFNWVDQALKWVHQHRKDFQFPITTVNMSLGGDWNATTVPQWATLESDLKQLDDDGIFIAVAAGNAFQTYNAVGVSYPAASPYVTPVASVDASGNLSRFSQRDQNVLAAPGEKIMSTLPDAFYGSDGIKNDWGAASGTSMASPYVAGTSVLVREAMQNLGYGTINESTIDDLLHRTADKVYDPATNANYDRINVSRALATLVGPDDFGSAAATAGSVGQLTTTLHVSGTIGSTSDQDFFQFVAARSGHVTMSLTDPQQLAASWKPAAGDQISGNKLTLDVVAGQSYVVGIAGGGTTIGKYSVDMQLSASSPSRGSPTPVNWGTIDQRTINDLAITGPDTWFQVTASHTGKFTAEAFYTQSRGNVDLEIYDAQQRLLGSSSGATGSERIDVNAAAGDTLYLHVKGANPDVDFRLTNLVSLSGSSATISGTAVGDVVRWDGGQQQLSLNGVTYSLAGVTQVSISGGGGSDSLTIVGSSAAENVVLRPSSADVTTADLHVSATGFANIQFSGDQADRATLYDSTANDTFEATPAWARMTGGGFTNFVSGVGSVVGISAAGGSDRATLHDSAGNDTLIAGPTDAVLAGAGFSIDAHAFGQTIVLATAGGYDTATLSGSSGADQLDVSAAYAWLHANGFSIRAEGFDRFDVNATSGGDFAHFIGSSGDDLLTVWGSNRNFFTGGVEIYTTGFRQAQFDGGGGHDSVDYYSSSRSSYLYGRSDYGLFVDQALRTQFNGVDSVLARLRASHRLKTDLAALEFYYRRIGT